MKVLTSLFILVLTLNHASAQDSIAHSSAIKAPWFVDRFKLTAGIFVPVSSTTLQVGVQGGSQGTQIDFQKDFGGPKSQATFISSLQWRITRRSRMSLNYYRIPQSTTHTLQRDITFNDQTYPVNASVNTFFNTSIVRVSYGYAILAKPDYELGLQIGAHVVGATAGLSINGTAGSISGYKDFGFTLPLPDLGIWGGYAFNNRMALNFEINYLALTAGDFTGRIFTYNATFIYRLVKKLDVTLGYTGLNVNLDVIKTNVEGQFSWGYSGPVLGVSYSFGKKYWQ